MTDLNTVIALQRGYVEKFGLMDKASLHAHKYWVCPDGQLTTVLPDYLNDANLYMGLFIEFPVGTTLTKTLDRYLIRNPGSESVNPFAQLADAIGTAICQAYCKIHGLDV